MKKLLLPLLIILSFNACKKNDTTAPVITLTWPSDNEVFAPGNVVHVKATITDNDAIHMVHVRVNNAATGAEVVHFEDHIDAQSYDVDQPFTIQTGVTYKIEVEATDHADNDSKIDITVKGS